MTIEHRIPRSVDPAAEAQYGNLLYACRYCNRSRSVALGEQGGRLLDPTEDAWADHFQLVGDELQPMPGNRDAKYTWRIYRLDDPIKLASRAWRASRLTECMDVLLQGPGRLKQFSNLAQTPGRASSERDFLLAEASELRKSLLRAQRDLASFSAIPADSDEKCRCGTTEHHELPAYLAVQTLSTPSP